MFCESCVNEDEAEDATLDDFPVKRGVQASRRQEAAYKKRRTRERLRDLPHEAFALSSWLAPAAEGQRRAHNELVEFVAACIEEHGRREGAGGSYMMVGLSKLVEACMAATACHL